MFFTISDDPKSECDAKEEGGGDNPNVRIHGL